MCFQQFSHGHAQTILPVEKGCCLIMYASHPCHFIVGYCSFDKGEIMTPLFVCLEDGNTGRTGK